MTFTLSHRDRAVIADLPEGCAYRVSEEAAGYDPSYTITTDGDSPEQSSDTSDATALETLSGDTLVSFVNVKRFLIPTGVGGDSRWLDVLLIVLMGGFLWKGVTIRKKSP